MRRTLWHIHKTFFCIISCKERCTAECGKRVYKSGMEKHIQRCRNTFLQNSMGVGIQALAYL